MKKIIAFAALLTICASGLAQLAGGPPVAVAAKFSELFPGATEVHWKTNAEAVGVGFNFNHEVSIAYFTREGDLIANGRRIPEVQLPMSVDVKLQALKYETEKKDGALAIASIYEFLRGDVTQYVVTLENEKISMLLVSEDGAMTIRKKSKKNEVNPDISLMAQLKHKK